MLGTCRGSRGLLPLLSQGGGAAGVASQLYSAGPGPQDGLQQPTRQASTRQAHQEAGPEVWEQVEAAAGHSGGRQPRPRRGGLQAPIDVPRTLHDYREMVLSLAQRKR